MDQVVICGASRTPMGGFQGCFAGVSASDLGGAAIKAALEQSGASPDDVQELLMGCVLPAGQGQAPARQAGFKAGLGQSVPATTLNKMCGSGMKAAMIAYDQLALGQTDLMVAGGMESMTEAPYLLPQMRGGARIGHGVILAGQVGVANRAVIGDRAIASSKSGIHGEVAAGEVVSGYPAIPNRLWLRCSAAFSKLPELARTVRELKRNTPQ